ncbi:FMN-binding protein [Alkaliphilus peptidifermentans]|uniref:FMN-binding domain-containing protein n=1 Tax=Alkaliphilus peptidifermentans DSM 18978 TaxID=1120976 RepID=A0A1G5EXR7_9FIRM|nr:FMN-binding protein [Alkaliphilus peptidifermentans]SCY31795.1 FMN-binding domain-containing protein [Alkaliphilus peptidifermentans DSM 18978]
MKKNYVALLLISTLLGVLLFGCGEKAVATSEPADLKYNDGVYEGVGKGFKGDIKLNVIIEDGKIADIKIVEMKETSGIGDVAVQEVVDMVIKNQTLDVDVVTGATISSEATINTIKKILEDI